MPSHRPFVTCGDAQALCKEIYHLEASCKELVSYDDRNFLVTAANGQQTLLKVHNSGEDGAFVQAVDTAMLGLQAFGIPCSTPLPLPSTTGSSASSSSPQEAPVQYHSYRSFPTSLDSMQCQQHIVRMLTYIPGSLMRDVPQTPQLLHSWGMLMGRLAVTVNHLWPTPGSAGRPQATITADEASTEYQAAVPGGNHPMHCDGVVPQGLMRDHAWRMEGAAATLRILLPQAQILSKEQRRTLSDIADEMEERAERMHALPKQVIHGDANEMNVLVDEAGTQVLGLIDFGDMSVSMRVAEPAIAAAYAALLAVTQRLQTTPRQQPKMQQVLPPQQQQPGDQQQLDMQGILEPAAAKAESGGLRGDADGQGCLLQAAMQAAAMVLAGYESVTPLTPPEHAAVPLLLRARIALSLASGAASVAADPGNAAYLLQTQKPGWMLLGCMEACRDGQLMAVLCSHAHAHTNVDRQ